MQRGKPLIGKFPNKVSNMFALILRFKKGDLYKNYGV